MTRYPKKGKGTKWTQKELLAIPAQWVNDTLADGDGLIGEVRVSKVGDVSIRFKYGIKWQGKKCWYSCGTFPLNDISSIRNQRDKAKELLKQGVDPRTQKHIDKIEAKAEQQTILEQQKKQQQRNKTFTDLFLAWIEQGVVRQDANTELRRTFEKDVLPVIGSVLIKQVTEDHIRTVYKTILARGTTQYPRERTVVKLAADMRQLFKWADMRQPWRSLFINGNPALLVNEKQLIPADYTEERDRILTPEEIQTLYQLIQQEQDHYNNATNKRGIKLPLNPATQCAIWICLSTLCRIGELLMAKWEHID